MLIAVTVTTALYIFVILLSVSAYPEGCASWVDYITHLDRYKGIDRFPAFYAAHYYLGDTGVYILMASLLALVFSSGPPILYGFAAMAVYKLAKQEGNKKYSILGGILIPITIAFLVFLILPMFSGNVLAPETYALMIAWSIIGLIYFNHIIRKDHTRKFGKAILVWVSLLAFVVILSLTWSQRMNEARENAVIKDISFIRNAFGETRDVRMIELIIDIADYLHVPVVAEGVETEEQ